MKNIGQIYYYYRDGNMQDDGWHPTESGLVKVLITYFGYPSIVKIEFINKPEAPFTVREEYLSEVGPKEIVRHKKYE